MRVSIKQLEALCTYINELKGTPIKAYDRIEGQFKANIGNYHLYQAYGAVGLHRMCNEGGGITEILSLSTKKELYDKMHAYIKGINNY
jgi:hypothetical protein